MTTPIPALYYLTFAVFEPLGLFAGAAFAIIAPMNFAQAYLGNGWCGDRSTGGKAGDSARLVAAGMGSCMLIIGVLSSFMIPSLVKQLQKQPAVLEKLLRTYLGCLLVGDFIHIFITLYYTPSHTRWSPSRWTILLWGNIAGTLLPNLARVAWFSGVGRTQIGGSSRGNNAGEDAPLLRSTTRH